MMINIACLKPRLVYFLSFLVCASLIAYALYLQHVKFIDPCPLCIFQRLIVISMGVVFLIAALHNPGKTGRIIYATLNGIVGLIGVGLASRHLWIQHQPPAKVSQCGSGLDYMLDTLPFSEVLTKVFHGTGECAEVSWQFLSISLPGWNLLFFLLMIAVGIILVFLPRYCTSP